MLTNARADIRNIRLLTLDLDDTLWAIEPVIARAEKKLHEWLAENAPQAARKFTAEGIRKLRGEAEKLFPALDNDITALRRKSIEMALLRSGENPDLEAEAFEVFWAARNDVELYPEVEGALAWLKENFTIAAVSNGNADVTSMPLREYFDFSLSARDAGVMKPAAEIFHKACAMAGCKPRNALHAGDDILCDVIGAHKAGLHAAWINRDAADWHSRQPEPSERYLHVGNLEELATSLGKPAENPERINRAS